MTSRIDLSDVSDAALLRLLLVGDAAYAECVKRNLVQEKTPDKSRGSVSLGGNKIDIY